MKPFCLLLMFLFADSTALDEAIARIRNLIQQQRVPEALDELKQMLARHKDDPEAQFQAGELMQELGESRFAQLEAVAPDSAEVHELHGHRLAAQGKDREALDAYRKALARKPDRNGLRYAIGNSLWRTGDREAALAEFFEEVRRNPGHAQANLRVGQILTLQGETPKALPYLQEAVRANPDGIEARRELGRALRKEGKAAEALEHLEYVARARPDDDQIHALLASAYRAVGREDRAREEMKRHRAILEKKLADAREAFAERTK